MRRSVDSSGRQGGRRRRELAKVFFILLLNYTVPYEIIRILFFPKEG